MKNGKTGPSINKGGSKQDYKTPLEFIRAVESRFGKITHDLAASPDNAVCADYYSESNSAFSHDWEKLNGILWCNPPFGDVKPWVKKASESGSAKILMLAPASIGSNWFSDYVFPHAIVLALSPRMSFDGKNSFPKDLILAVYGFGCRGFDIWKWRRYNNVS